MTRHARYPSRDRRIEPCLPTAGRRMPQQPAWRQDFPIDWPQDQYVERRDFVKFLVLTSLAFSVGPVLDRRAELAARREASRRVRSASPRWPIVAVGASLVFDYPGEHDPACWSARRNREFVAYSQKCTHLSCAVIPEARAGRAPLPVSRGRLRSAHRPAARRAAAAAAAADRARGSDGDDLRDRRRDEDRLTRARRRPFTREQRTPIVTACWPSS